MIQKDFLTDLNAMEFLNSNYSKYMQKHKNSNMIAIDFTKLKYINDNFGHAVGDDCLKLFGKLAKKYFLDSLLIRRSGDEFVFVTGMSNKELEHIFKCFNNDIATYTEDKVIPVIFGFNCGIKPCEENLCETLFKADITMYQAKLEKLNYKYYTDDIYKKIENSTSFIDTIYKTCNTKSFKFAVQPIVDFNKNTKIFEIYSRDSNNKSIFEHDNFRLLKINYMFKIIDLCNLEYFFKTNFNFLENNTVMININSQTLFSKQFDFLNFITTLKNTNNIDTSNIILSININDFNESNEVLIDVINGIKSLNFKICLDAFSLDTIHTIFHIISNTGINYVKISKSILKQSVLNEKNELITKNIINAFNDLNIIPIFSTVETKQEASYTNKYINAFKKGNYYVKEVDLNEYGNNR